MSRSRGVAKIRNLSVPLGEKQKKMLHTEHGKHKVDFYNTFAAKRPLFFRHLYRRGVSKMAICVSHVAWEAKKRFLRSIGSILFIFTTPLDWYSHFFSRHARFRLIQAGSGRRSIPCWDLGVQLGPHYSRRGWWLREFTNKLPQMNNARNAGREMM